MLRNQLRIIMSMVCVMLLASPALAQSPSMGEDSTTEEGTTEESTTAEEGTTEESTTAEEGTAEEGTAEESTTAEEGTAEESATTEEGTTEESTTAEEGTVEKSASDQAEDNTEQAEESAEEAGEAAEEAEKAAEEAQQEAKEAADAAKEADKIADEQAATEERVRALEQKLIEQRQDTAAAIGAAEQANMDAKSSQAEAEKLKSKAVAAQQKAKAIECQLREARGLECIDPADQGVWVGYLDIGGSFSLNSATNVPGEARGLSIGANAKIAGVLDFIKGKHEWRNSLKWDIGATRSASDEIWVKSIDRFQLSSGYYYNITDWFGTFLEVQMQANFFPLVVRTSETTNFEFTRTDGTTFTRMGTNERLTDPFEPVTFDERGGVYFQIFERTYLNWIARAGLGAQQFLVGDFAYYETGEEGNTIHFEQLDKYGLFGVMADTELRGAVKEGLVQYGVRAAILYPFIDTNSDQLVDDNGDDISPLQVDLGAFVGFSVNDWLGFRVSAEGYRQPQITGKEWQSRVNMLATFSYSMFGNKEAARDASAGLKYKDLVGADGDADVNN